MPFAFGQKQTKSTVGVQGSAPPQRRFCTKSGLPSNRRNSCRASFELLQSPVGGRCLLWDGASPAVGQARPGTRDAGVVVNIDNAEGPLLAAEWSGTGQRSPFGSHTSAAFRIGPRGRGGRVFFGLFFCCSVPLIGTIHFRIRLTKFSEFRRRVARGPSFALTFFYP